MSGEWIQSCLNRRGDTVWTTYVPEYVAANTAAAWWMSNDAVVIGDIDAGMIIIVRNQEWPYPVPHWFMVLEPRR